MDWASHTAFKKQTYPDLESEMFILKKSMQLLEEPGYTEEKKVLLELYRSRLEEIKAIMSGNAPPETGRTDMAAGGAQTDNVLAGQDTQEPDSADLLTLGQDVQADNVMIYQDSQDKEPDSAVDLLTADQDAQADNVMADRGAQDKDTDLDSILKMVGASDNIEQSEKEPNPPEPDTPPSQELDDEQIQQIKDEIRKALARLESAEIQ